MEIKTPEKVKEVKEVSYTWNAGMSLDLVIDEGSGDKVVDMGDFLHIHLAAKPLVMNPEETASAEDIVIYKSTLASVITRKRTMRLPTLEQIEEYKATIHKMPKMVQ